ncbi:MAG: transcriptional repressor NrdR [Methylotenera sp.]|nr:transcriptional repressor NrdR [Oligoflexia bacterium]
MKCPYCSTPETKVIDSRLNQTGDSTRRRRECPRCEGRFTTYERVEEVMPLVIKKDGRREPFNREKIQGGLEKSCQKLAVPAQKIEEVIVRIEKRLQSYGLKEVPSKTVGQMVMAELHALDKVAYVRFASVYRDFRDVEEFVAELQEPPSGVSAKDSLDLMFPFADSNNSTPEGTSKS